MRVLHITPSYLPAYGFGGSVKAVHGLCRELVRKNIDVEVLTTNIGLEDRKDIEPDTPYEMDGVKITYHQVAFPRSFSYSFRFRKTLEEKIRSFDIIHMHAVYRYTTFTAAALCQKYNKPYLLNPFGALDPSMISLKGRIKKGLYIKFIERKNAANAAVLHAASEQEKDSLGLLGISNRIEIIPPAIDPAEYANSENIPRLDENFPGLKGKKKILFLGRIHPKKGLDMLAKAFASLCRKADVTALVIAGSGEERYVARVKSIFNKTGIPDKVLFTGMLLGPDKLSALYGSDIFVLPSYGENFGISVLEALVCGLPVVITDKTALASDVKEYDAGIVTACSPQEITRAMLELLRDGALKKRFGENGRRLAAERFTSGRIADKVIGIYRDILNR